jgi:hypothetical protein
VAAVVTAIAATHIAAVENNRLLYPPALCIHRGFARVLL